MRRNRQRSDTASIG